MLLYWMEYNISEKNLEKDKRRQTDGHTAANRNKRNALKIKTQHDKRQLNNVIR